MKFKVIRRGKKIFLFRLSFPTKTGSIKIHLILSDDTDHPHMHPWDFKSFLLLGAYKEIVDNKSHRHWPFAIVKRKSTEHHQVFLYKVFGVRIPCLTIGKYTKKIQPWCEHKSLCTYCQKLGYCADKAYWENLQKK